MLLVATLFLAGPLCCSGSPALGHDMLKATFLPATERTWVSGALGRNQSAEYAHTATIRGPSGHVALFKYTATIEHPDGGAIVVFDGSRSDISLACSATGMELDVPHQAVDLAVGDLVHVTSDLACDQRGPVYRNVTGLARRVADGRDHFSITTENVTATAFFRNLDLTALAPAGLDTVEESSDDQSTRRRLGFIDWIKKTTKTAVHSVVNRVKSGVHDAKDAAKAVVDVGKYVFSGKFDFSHSKEVKVDWNVWENHGQYYYKNEILHSSADGADFYCLGCYLIGKGAYEFKVHVEDYTHAHVLAQITITADGSLNGAGQWSYSKTVRSRTRDARSPPNRL